MPSAAALKVLVVDDQLTIRSLVRSGLHQMGVMNIMEAGDGEAALRMLVENGAHLVISDFNMPVMDGIELLKAIRGHATLAKTAFVMLTGQADKTLVQKAVAAGVNNLLVKPFTVATLRAKIEGVFGKLT